jgi:putative addiction module CopG family antidote
MSKTYTPGPEVDAIVDRQLARGNFATGEEVVRAGVALLEAQETELEELRRLIDEGDAAYARGEYTTYGSADEFLEDVVKAGEQRLRRKG